MSAAPKITYQIVPSLERGEQTPGDRIRLSVSGWPRPQELTGPSLLLPSAPPSLTLPPPAVSPNGMSGMIMAPRARRAPPREPYLCRAMLTVLEGDERYEGKVRAVDFLPGGVRISLTSHVLEGTRVKVEVTMPNTLTVRGEGYVVRSRAVDRSVFLVDVAFDMAPVLLDETKETSWRI